MAEMTKEKAARRLDLSADIMLFEADSPINRAIAKKLYLECATAYRMGAAALRSLQGWIKTADRLPERMELLPCSVRVLISCAMGVVSAQYDFQDNVWVDNFNHKHSPWSKMNVYDQSMQVTHWMPTPPPPEVEE